MNEQIQIVLIITLDHEDMERAAAQQILLQREFKNLLLPLGTKKIEWEMRYGMDYKS